MKIVCATNMPYALEAFGTLGEAVVLEGRTLTSAEVREAEILAIRSTTRVDRELLTGSRVRFVGTATIGTDHLDIPYFEQAGISWCFAAGCNANSVSEYFVAALLWLGKKYGLTLEGKTVGVVGVGNVGRRVVQKAQALGLRVLQNDPPLARQTGNPVFVSLEQVLAEADIVTLHVPLNKDGPDATLRLADRRFFDRLKRGAIFINAARGGVVVSHELLAAIDRGVVAHAVLDTWEGEPIYRREVLDRVDLGTPHIAGHSFEGKVMGTVMVYQEACRFLGVPAAWSPVLPPPLVPEVNLDAKDRSDEAVLADLAGRIYDIEADDRRLRAASVPDDRQRGELFDALRRDYPERREFPATTVNLTHGGDPLWRKALALGFKNAARESAAAQ